MPWQLIYTSGPRGLTPGQSGYCTVARSRDLREALIPRLEKWSYYHPDAGEEKPVICAYRILDMPGGRYHVLTRICDAGLDFTKRRNFLAHHLIFAADELPEVTPALLFLRWKGWQVRWEGEPKLLDAPTGFAIEPASAWEQLTGRAGNAPGLLDAQWVTGDAEERRLFLAALDETLRGEKNPWGVSFTNYFQRGDEVSDFRILGVWSEEAQKGKPVRRLRELRSNRKEEPAVVAKAAPKTEPAPVAAQVGKKTSWWPLAAGLAAVAAIVVASRTWKSSAPVIEPVTTASPGARSAAEPEAARAAAPAAVFNIEKVFPKNAEGGRVWQKPEALIHQPRQLVRIDKQGQTATMRGDVESGLREVMLPEGSAFALRPAKDFVAEIADDFGLLASTIFDLTAIRSQIERVINERENNARTLEEELSGLVAKDKELLTSARTPEELKRSERIAVLKLAASVESKELAELRKKAAVAPKDIAEIGSFSLVLCQTNVCQEIVRFDEEPELVRIASP